MDRFISIVRLCLDSALERRVDVFPEKHGPPLFQRAAELHRDLAFLTMGETTIGKSVFPADTNDTIAAHFAYFLNETFSGVWASVSSNVLTITNRRHDHRQRLARKRSRGNVAGGRCSLDCAEPRGRDWHADFFAEIQAKGWTAVGTFSMEFVDPPDSPPSKVWAARYLDGQAVLTATGFANLNSTHCIFSSDVLAYQKKMLRPLAEQCRHHRNAVGVRGQLSARQLHRRKQEVMESPRQAARRAGRDSTGPTHGHRDADAALISSTGSCCCMMLPWRIDLQDRLSLFFLPRPNHGVPLELSSPLSVDLHLHTKRCLTGFFATETSERV